MAATELPDLPGPTVDLVFPELTVNPVLPEPTVLPAPKARMELLVGTARPERRVLKARPALRGPKALKVAPESANLRVRVNLKTKLENTTVNPRDRCRRRRACPPVPGLPGKVQF